MQQNIEVGSVWVDKSGEMIVVVLWSNEEEQRVGFEYLLVIDGKLDLTRAHSSIDFFLKTKEPMVALSHSNKEYVKGKTEGYDEGYQHGFELAKGMISDELDSRQRSDYKIAEDFCEHHNPNKETQEAMQEVLDRESNKLEGIWSAKDGGGKLEVVTINGDYCRVVLVEGIENSSLIAGDTLNLHINNLKKYWTKERKNIANKDEQLEKELELVEKYPHYYKDIRHLNIIDIYRFFDLFEVTDPCIQHSLKKLAVGGKRGAKDYEKDIKEAMDTLKRWEYMQEENKRGLDD